jgi:hypothetical protein
VWELKQAARAGLRLRITWECYITNDHAPDYQHFTRQASALRFETDLHKGLSSFLQRPFFVEVAVTPLYGCAGRLAPEVTSLAQLP